ncbi:MAG: ABC transporter permease subunit [Verrucomicrobiota bacterium]
MSAATAVITAPSGVSLSKGRSLWQDAWARFRKNRLAVGCTVLLAFIGLLCAFGPTVAFYKFGMTGETQDLVLKASPPSAQHWFGTDSLGRDLLVRTLEGGRVSLKVALIATLVALLIGVSYGATAGYVGGRADSWMMRVVDILYAMPFMLFVILLTVAFGKNMTLLYLAIGAVEWLTMARIVRAQVLTLARQEFVEAARSLGLPGRMIIFRHIVPNVLGPVIVYTTLTIPAVMLLEAALSFLGLGVQPPDSSWGTLIDDGANNMETYWWMLAFPAGIFSLTLFCLNFAGDGLRDALDVKSGKD